ncbi:ABC transporter permease (plasmid) [Cytobacillus firmus]|uniref:ABC transporter permease n=3 Tax=Cytobacillus TaxID=2675230 RepID=A0AA46P5Z6_CYTFI|nr:MULTISPECIES: ABC transporter permease [Cytobacillus]AND43010.1 ABC transporter permease [Cytobacillus oceanisediminis 2691]EWG09273.1 glutathione import ATP-binding protein GsiA [Cytobacillus firmus DS1]MCM3244612.1 ABC transporter permease [Cytobacillus oceanisediminis]USK41801.1 ABC transporter permease [Cytobacillus firmus]USK47528.1 ABC transporter permease [Cytobacillus oceanisediminis]
MVNSRWKKYWQVLTSNNIGLFGLILLVIFLLIAILAPILAPFDPTDRVGAPFTKPNGQFLLGTNDVGQDILSELLYGTRISLLIGVIAAFISILLGCLVGIVSGYYGGKVDAFLMRLVDLVLVIPFLPLMILLAAFIGPSFWNIVLVISLISWASPARVIRSQVLTLKTKGYVEAAKSIGTNIKVILARHILPGVIPIALSQFVLAASHSILIEASLSFLGLGDPFTKSWGTILYYAQARGAFLTDAWIWWVLPPGLLITTLVIGFAFTGYSLEEILNPRLRKER